MKIFECKEEIKSDKEKNESGKIRRNYDKMCNKIAINTYLSTTTLNENEVDAPIKRHRVSEWKNKKKKKKKPKQHQKNKTHLYPDCKRLILD